MTSVSPKPAVVTMPALPNRPWMSALVINVVAWTIGAVMSAGRLVATFARGEWTEDGIMAAAISGYLTGQEFVQSGAYALVQLVLEEAGRSLGRPVHMADLRTPEICAIAARITVIFQSSRSHWIT